MPEAKNSMMRSFKSVSHINLLHLNKHNVWHLSAWLILVWWTNVQISFISQMQKQTEIYRHGIYSRKFQSLIWPHISGNCWSRAAPASSPLPPLLPAPPMFASFPCISASMPSSQVKPARGNEGSKGQMGTLETPAGLQLQTRSWGLRDLEVGGSAEDTLPWGGIGKWVLFLF